MAKKYSETEIRLRANVLDAPKYSRKQIIWAEINLVIGLWGPFIGFTLVLFFMSQGLLGPILDWTAPTILTK